MSVSTCFDCYEPEPDFAGYWPEETTGNGYHPEELSASAYYAEKPPIDRAEGADGYEPEVENGFYWPECLQSEACEETHEIETLRIRFISSDARVPVIRLLKRLAPKPEKVRVRDRRTEVIHASAKVAQQLEDLVGMSDETESPEIDLAISRILRAAQKLKKRMQARETKKAKSSGTPQLTLL